MISIHSALLGTVSLATVVVKQPAVSSPAPNVDRVLTDTLACSTCSCIISGAVLEHNVTSSCEELPCSVASQAQLLLRTLQEVSQGSRVQVARCCETSLCGGGDTL